MPRNCSDTQKIYPTPQHTENVSEQSALANSANYPTRLPALPHELLLSFCTPTITTTIHNQGSLCLLQKAKLLTRPEHPFLGNARLQARALTLNNLGCLMKKWGKVHEGVKFLARAIRIEAEVPGGADNPAGTHVNMSAALSTLGFHRAAAAHAGHAIDLASHAIMRQAAGSSMPSEEDSITTEGNSVDKPGAGSVEKGGPASVHVSTADDAGSNSWGSGDAPTAVVRGAPGSTSDAPPLLQGPADGVTIDSAAADNGRCSATSSSSATPTQDVSPGTPDQENEGVQTTTISTNSSAAHDRGMPFGRVNTSGVTEETSSIERRETLSAAAGGLLAIASFNLGVEREHLGQLDAALSSYEDARVAANQYLGPENPVAKGIGVALEQASAAAVATASYSSKRAAWRARSAVSSFPSIGKLKFGPRTPGEVSGFGGNRVSPRRLRQQQQQQHRGQKTARDLLDRAYSCARPCPAPPHTDSWSRLGRVFSPRSPPTAPGSDSTGGPQRAGRWTKSDAPHAARPVKKAQWPPGGGGKTSPRCSADEDLRWRALACTEWQCSPREALHAQQTANQRVDVGVPVPAGIGIHTTEG